MTPRCVYCVFGNEFVDWLCKGCDRTMHLHEFQYRYAEVGDFVMVSCKACQTLTTLVRMPGGFRNLRRAERPQGVIVDVRINH